MKKGIQILYRILCICLMASTAVSMLAVIVVGIRKPINHLIPWQMAAGMIVGTTLLIAGFVLWNKEIRPVWWWSALAAYVLFLYVLSALARNSHYSFVDYSIVYDGAMDLAQGRELADSGYFLIYPNNFKLMLLLKDIFYAGLRLGFQDPYYFALGIGVLQVAAAVIAADDLLRSGPEYEKYGFPLFCSFVLLLPVYANVQAFYTDQMSFWQAVCALALLRRAYQAYERNRGRACLLAGAAGAVCALGYLVKATAFIPVIAAGILFGMKALRDGKLRIVPGVIALLCGVAVLWGAESRALQYDVYARSKDTANPVISWIAIGMAGRGSYGADMDFAQTLNSLPAKSEKQAYAKQYIAEHKEQFWNIDHILEKLNWNFADGSLGTKDFTYYGETPDNIVYEFFSPWGKYFWRSQQLCYVYLFMMYLTYFLGAVLGVFRLLQKKDLPGGLLLGHLDLLGNIIFLMLWEANNRQLYNQMPVLLFGWICNLILIRESIRGRLHVPGRRTG